MALAFEELFAVPDAFRGIPMPGRTDALILSDAAVKHGIASDASDLARFPDVYLRHLASELEKPGPRKGVMPGVRALLDALLRRDDVYLALLTGNYEAAARVKLQYFDLWRYFPCGAFGDHAPDRNALLAKAVARVLACGGPRVDRPTASSSSAIRRSTSPAPRREAPARSPSRPAATASANCARPAPTSCSRISRTPPTSLPQFRKCEAQSRYNRTPRKRTGPGGPPGLQNRLLPVYSGRLGSTPRRFRHRLLTFSLLADPLPATLGHPSAAAALGTPAEDALRAFGFFVGTWECRLRNRTADPIRSAVRNEIILRSSGRRRRAGPSANLQA